eukprot:2903148-Pleurochrysis_carterae.AAC.3
MKLEMIASNEDRYLCSSMISDHGSRESTGLWRSLRAALRGELRPQSDGRVAVGPRNGDIERQRAQRGATRAPERFLNQLHLLVHG